MKLGRWIVSVFQCHGMKFEFMSKTLSGSEGFKQESDINRFGFWEGG